MREIAQKTFLSFLKFLLATRVSNNYSSTLNTLSDSQSDLEFNFGHAILSKCCQNLTRPWQSFGKILPSSYQDLRTLQDSYEILSILQDLDCYEIFQDFIKIVSRYCKIHQNRKNRKNNFEMNTSLKDTANDSKQ